jgi:hypothetical protein
MHARRHREDHPHLFTIETKPLPVTWLGPAPRSGPKRPSIKFVCLVLGGALLLASAVGAAYWSQRRQIPATAIVASPLVSPAQPAPTAAVAPAVPPGPQLAVGIPWLSGHTTSGSVAAQTPVPAPSQPPRLAVGLRPIAGQTPPDAPAPEPTETAPPAAEPLPSPAELKPHRKAANPQASPVANPNQSPGVVKY